jgi:hypothetical protein
MLNLTAVLELNMNFVLDSALRPALAALLRPLLIVAAVDISFSPALLSVLGLTLCPFHAFVILRLLSTGLGSALLTLLASAIKPALQTLTLLFQHKVLGLEPRQTRALLYLRPILYSYFITPLIIMQVGLDSAVSGLPLGRLGLRYICARYIGYPLQVFKNSLLLICEIRLFLARTTILAELLTLVPLLYMASLRQLLAPSLEHLLYLDGQR